MFSEVQVDFLGSIVAQHDYYIAYYYGNYYEYQVGEPRDYKIQLFVSDQKPTFENGVYFFDTCNYYEVTSNKYMLLESDVQRAFVPLSGTDIVYSNVIDGAPQLCYVVSSIRSDAGPAVMYGTIAIVGVAVLLRVLFGGRS